MKNLFSALMRKLGYVPVHHHSEISLKVHVDDSQVIRAVASLRELVDAAKKAEKKLSPILPPAIYLNVPSACSKCCPGCSTAPR